MDKGNETNLVEVLNKLGEMNEYTCRRCNRTIEEGNVAMVVDDNSDISLFHLTYKEPLQSLVGGCYEWEVMDNNQAILAYTFSYDKLKQFSDWYNQENK